MALKHLWVGKIESSEQYRKKMRRIGKINLVLGGFVFIVASLIIIINPGGQTTVHTNGDFIRNLFVPLVGLSIFGLGVAALIQRTYNLNMHILIDKEDSDKWIQTGLLIHEIDRLLSSGGILFQKVGKFYYQMYYNLPDGLNLGIGNPIEQGHVKGTKVFVLIIQIQRINTNNMQLARKIRDLLDNLTLEDKYLSKEEKGAIESMESDGGK